MKRIIYPLGLIMLMLVSLMSCKKEGIDIVNKNFNVELRQPQGEVVPRVGEQLTFNLSITGFDIENNKGEIETYFYVKNEEGESTGAVFTTEQKEVPLGKNFEYDYRKNGMSLDFLYTPTQDGDQDLVVEIRCGGVTKTATLHLVLKTKSIIVTATGGGKIVHKGKTETSFSLLMKYGETASFKAVPQDKHKFAGWYIGEKKVATTLDYVHRADRDARIEARFKPMSYKVTPQINIPEAGVVATTTGRDTFEDGDLVEVRVTPNEKHKDGYIFKGWYVDNQLVGNQLTYAFNAKDDVAPIAQFERKSFTFHYNKKSAVYYKISLNGNDELRQNIQYGKEYTLYLKSQVTGDSNIEQEMIYELGNFELNGKTHVSFNHVGKEGFFYQVSTIKVICRGEAHVRIRLITRIDHGDHNFINDDYIDN